MYSFRYRHTVYKKTQQIHKISVASDNIEGFKIHPQHCLSDLNSKYREKEHNKIVQSLNVGFSDYT